MADSPTPHTGAPPGSGTPPATGAAHRVLARKYRPSHFGELIGQAPMVRTLRNAFAHRRIPQAWMLTGVRGVGKTTTARILARALNYERDGVRAPTVDLELPGVHCQAIMEGRHVDVIEMDAASHTGISDIREITDAARYKPVSALHKVYIIDEVHMLSVQAFNGLLKTLEEPPGHVKFIFATTEIRKVPVTVLSRCQRFDLRRIEADVLVAHLAAVAAAEGVAADEAALALIARAAEGSVRDALSLLDQAIAHGGGAVSAEGLREMLGLADRARVVDLFEHVMSGDVAAALAELAAQYEVGAEPSVVLTELAAFTHQVTRLKATGLAPDGGDPQELRERAKAFAAGLPMASLSRMWQALLTGIAEVQAAAKPLVAAEMVVIRLAYMASLPDPAALPLTEAPTASPAAVRGTIGSAPTGNGREPSGQGPARSAAARRPASLGEVAALVGEHSLRLKHSVERDMRLKRFEEGRIEVSLEPGAAPDCAGTLGQKLTEITGERWIVTVSEGATARTLAEVEASAQAQLRAEAAQEPLVRAILDRFPDATIAEVRTNPREDAGPASGRAREQG
ncbi:DNA polymerase III subunit gamma/tau [Acuticoccus sp.]|uniref:DNA polymerase III subunit gamma/tau n=1 Tax=Acuticoccus sp. TaxID=1904378 RepID=UPI003B5273DC